MASLRFDKVSFIAYPQDHEARHVHGFAGEVEVIVDLRNDGTSRSPTVLIACDLPTRSAATYARS